MARIIIKCFPAPGYDGVFRAGRKWPGTGTIVDTQMRDDAEQSMQAAPFFPHAWSERP